MRLLLLQFAILFALMPLVSAQAQAQDAPLNFLTIERPPFAFHDGETATGFSIDLMREIAMELDREVTFTFVDEFSEMLERVAAGQADGAAANISITSEREVSLDFSRPIFGSGLAILVSGTASSANIWSIVFQWQVLGWVVAAFGALFLLGMLMWVFERGRQAYFDRGGAMKAMFPSFWWSLNLILNGGFEVNEPRSIPGRILGVVMVVSSLFVVSLFVANITAALTVEAITGTIQSLEDLRGRRVGTTEGSTASTFLLDRDIAHVTYATLQDLTEAFEMEQLDVVFFDGPILAHYLTHEFGGEAYLVDRNFRPEDYGIALEQGSELREPINRALLRLAETGRYDALRLEWFGDIR